MQQTALKQQSRLQQAGSTLLSWYQSAKRDLPWRHTREAYPIWVSEVMLQQTRVDSVIPYYHRFIERFPTAQDLAHATEEEVLAYWQGLGYYSRARNLQAGVRELVTRYDGVLPRKREQLLELQGIGPYTAGALLSLVYNLPEAAVDGNVLRVISRLECLRDSIELQATRQTVSDCVLQMMPAEQAADFNQALMELGALICNPKSPDCTACPLETFCLAHQAGIAESLPHKKVNKAPQRQDWLVGVIRYKNQFLLQQRPTKGLLAGMWQFPMVQFNMESPAAQQLRDFFQQQGIAAEVLQPLPELQHIFSHRKWYLQAYVLELEQVPEKLPAYWQWHSCSDPILWAGPHQKIALASENDLHMWARQPKDK